MDNKELMRGDYVMFFNSHKIGKIAKVDQILRNSCLLLYNNFPDETEYYNEIIVNNEDIHPIKLTSKIMDENKFEQIGTELPDYLIQGCVYWSSFAGRIFMQGHPNQTEYIDLGECQYVHELQHILKQDKIKKEIIL